MASFYQTFVVYLFLSKQKFAAHSRTKASKITMTKFLLLVLGVNVAFLNVIVDQLVEGQYCNTYKDCPSATKCCRQNECVSCSSPAGCTSDSECGQGQQCCKGSCSYWCTDETCAADGDCTGTGKCCRSNICVTECREPKSECDYDSDCPYSADYCCRNLSGHGKCNLNCLGMPCRNYTDCAKDENCWSNKCAIVIWCNRNTDCPVKQCCTTTSFGGRCEDCNYDYGMPAWQLTVIIFASIFGVITIMVIVVQCVPCLRKRSDEVARQWEMSGVNHTGGTGLTFPVLS